MSLTLTCEANIAYLSDYLDGQLSPWQAFKVWLHLLFCPDCRALLATLSTLPGLVQELQESGSEAAEAALQGALARISAPPEARGWPATAVPAEAAELLCQEPDLPLAILAAAHEALVRVRHPEPGPYHLPKDILGQLPPEGQWRWLDGADGRRRAEILQDPQLGQKLVLAFSPPGARTAAHRHLGSESILVLSGSLNDKGLAFSAGDWIHHGRGSVHAPAADAEACWCLIREEGAVAPPGPMERLRLAREMS